MRTLDWTTCNRVTSALRCRATDAFFNSSRDRSLPPRKSQAPVQRRDTRIARSPRARVLCSPIQRPCRANTRWLRFDLALILLAGNRLPHGLLKLFLCYVSGRRSCLRWRVVPVGLPSAVEVMTMCVPCFLYTLYVQVLPYTCCLVHTVHPI